MCAMSRKNVINCAASRLRILCCSESRFSIYGTSDNVGACLETRGLRHQMLLLRTGYTWPTHKLKPSILDFFPCLSMGFMDFPVGFLPQFIEQLLAGKCCLVHVHSLVTLWRWEFEGLAIYLPWVPRLDLGPCLILFAPPLHYLHYIAYITYSCFRWLLRITHNRGKPPQQM